jgi:hypothetical protein
MLEWKPRLILVLAAAAVVASQLGVFIRAVNHGW